MWQFYSPINDGVLNLVSVPTNQFGIVWLECKMVPPRQHCIFTTLKKKSQTFSPKAFHKPDLSQKSLHWESAGDAELNSVKALLFFSLVGSFVENVVVLGGLA